MERMLQKMASQLNAYDEASLLALWDKYATIVERFEPTKRWEEAAIIFSLIQAVRLKNQLFNQHLAAGLETSRNDTALPGMNKTKAWFEEQQREKAGKEDSELPVASSKAKKRCKVLSFRGSKRDKPV